MKDGKADWSSVLGSDDGSQSGHEITSHGTAGSLPDTAGTHRGVRKQFANSRKMKMPKSQTPASTRPESLTRDPLEK
ncbi:hypothetical protein CC79DRAFT_1055259 [Sarocladium strictum]